MKNGRMDLAIYKIEKKRIVGRWAFLYINGKETKNTEKIMRNMYPNDRHFYIPKKKRENRENCKRKNENNRKCSSLDAFSRHCISIPRVSKIAPRISQR